MEIKNKYNPTIIREMFLALLPAQVFSMITSCISTIVNGLLMANFLSPLSLVALGFASPLTNIIGASSGIVAGGARIVSGRIIGRGKLDELKRTYSESILTITLIGVVFSFTCLFFSDNIALILGASKESLVLTSKYIKGLAFGFIPTLIVPSLIVFLQMINLGYLSLIATIVMVVCDLLLSLINLFVLDGGIFGMSLSSSISSLIAMIILFYFLSKRKDFVRFELKDVSLKNIIEILTLGFPGTLFGFMCSFRNIMLNSLALKLQGAAAVSALTILSTTMSPFDNVCGGIGYVSTSLSSVFVGENDKTSLKTLFKETIKIGHILVIFRLIIVFLFGKGIISLFTKDPLVMKLTYEAIIWYALCMFTNIIYLSFTAQFQAFGRVLFVNILYVFSAFVFAVGFAYGLSYFLDIRGIWLSYLFNETTTVILILIISFIRNKKISFSLEDVFDYDGYIKEGESIQISLKTIDEVIKISEKIEEFISLNTSNHKMAMYAGLCVEELTGNIIDHGFSKKKKHDKDSIDVYVSIIDENTFIRIKDNSIPFDLRKKFLEDKDDPCKNIGIRVVSKIAKEINYQSNFGMNIVSITL